MGRTVERKLDSLGWKYTPYLFISSSSEFSQCTPPPPIIPTPQDKDLLVARQVSEMPGILSGHISFSKAVGLSQHHFQLVISSREVTGLFFSCRVSDKWSKFLENEPFLQARPGHGWKGAMGRSGRWAPGSLFPVAGALDIEGGGGELL